MTTHFTVDIRLGNAAMRSGSDVAEALRHVAKRVEDRGDFIDDENDLIESSSGSFMDLNGATVGRWEVSDLVTKSETPEQVARRVLDNHAIQPHWVRNGGQMISLLAEAVRLGRGESA
jgi:hypothetical protein